MDERGYGDQLRQQVALLAGMVATEQDILARLDQMPGFPGTAELREQSERGMRYLRQLGSVQAAQALAHDDFIAAGGPDDAEAVAAYEAATARNIALFPADDLKWTPPPLPGDDDPESL